MPRPERDVRCRREPIGVGTPDRSPHGSRRPRYREGDRCAHTPDMALAREDARCWCTATRSQPSPYREPEPSGSRHPDNWARLLLRHPMPPRSDDRQRQARRCYGRLIHSRHSARSSSHAVRRLARRPARLRYMVTAVTSASARKARRIVLVMGVATFGGGDRLSAEVLGGYTEPSGRYAE
jgi:hypothetical protein